MRTSTSRCRPARSWVSTASWGPGGPNSRARFLGLDEITGGSLLRDGALGFVTPRRERHGVAPTVTRMAVRLASLDQPVAELSGGNQQKVSVGKWLASDIDILIIDEPTIGVDVRTKEEMYGVIEASKRAGMAILVISSDIAEVIRISNRILVMAEKRIVLEQRNAGSYQRISEEILHAIVSIPHSAPVRSSIVAPFGTGTRATSAGGCASDRRSRRSSPEWRAQRLAAV